MAYPPTMLPAASWHEMMRSLDDHFGDNAELDAATARQIGAYLAAHSARQGRGEYGERSWRATRDRNPPLRISETDYFRGQHHEIPAKMVAGIRALCKDNSLEVHTDIDTPKRLPFDEEDMLELLGNLLDNAAKWARRRVHLSLRWGEGVQVLVEDDGPGIEPDAEEVLSIRGSRLDESIPGHGLGLSVVREIVRGHSGHLSFGRSEQLGGFASTIDLPGPQNQ